MDWAKEFFRQVYRRWGFPAAMVSDRGGQFILQFWKTLFKQAGTKLHMTTAYHPSADGQAEQTNQSVEIALQHVVNGRQDDWVSFLEEIESAHNNLKNSTTGKAPNKIIYGQTTRTALDAALPASGITIGTEEFLQN